jgi:hypothetical protein
MPFNRGYFAPKAVALWPPLKTQGIADFSVRLNLSLPVALSLIAYALDDSRNPFPSCRWFAGKLPAFTPLEQQCNYVTKDGVLEVAYASG